jgi:hypothetical protein
VCCRFDCLLGEGEKKEEEDAAQRMSTREEESLVSSIIRRKIKSSLLQNVRVSYLSELVETRFDGHILCPLLFNISVDSNVGRGCT